MVASFHVARTAAELILRRDKAAVPGRGRGGWPEKKKDVFGTLYPISDSCPVDNQFLLLYGLRFVINQNSGKRRPKICFLDLEGIQILIKI